MWTLAVSADTFTAIDYGPEVLAAASLDSNVYLVGRQKAKFSLRAPALALAWQGTHLYSGGAEQHISVYDAESGRLWDIGGDHAGPISALVASSQGIISAGCDGQVQLADPRANTGLFYRFPAKILDLSLGANSLVVGMAGQRLSVYDVRQLSKPVVARKMQFQHPIRAVEAFPCGTRYAVSSVASRVVVESMADPTLDFSFRAHQSPSHSYMINDMAVRDGHLVTAGADRAVVAWDLDAKTKAKEYEPLPLPVEHLAFSNSQIAVAVADDSYTRTPGAVPGPGQLLVASA